MEKKYKDKLIKEELMIMDEIDRICTEDNLNYFLTAGSLLGAVRHGGVIPWDDDIDIAMPRNDFEKFVNSSYTKLKDNFYLDYTTINKKYFPAFAKVRIKNTMFKEKYIKRNLDWGIWIDIFPLDNISKNDIKNANNNKSKIKFLNSILAHKYALKFNQSKKIRGKILHIVSKFISTNLIVKKRNIIMKKYNNENNEFFINYGSQYSVEKQTHEKEKYFPAKYIDFENRKYKAPNDINYVLTKIYGKNYMQLPPKEKRISHNPLYIQFSDGECINFEDKISNEKEKGEKFYEKI